MSEAVDHDAVPVGLVAPNRRMTDDEVDRFRDAFLAASRNGQTSALASKALVSRTLPLSRWQAYKRRHADTWWLGWWVRRWPVSRREIPLDDPLATGRSRLDHDQS